MGLFGKFQRSTKGSMAMVGIVVSIVIFTALLPVIAAQIAGATNLTATEKTILGITTTLLVLGVVVMAARKAGLGGKNL